jgi:hypothetical protein
VVVARLNFDLVTPVRFDRREPSCIPFAQSETQEGGGVVSFKFDRKNHPPTTGASERFGLIALLGAAGRFFDSGSLMQYIGGTEGSVVLAEARDPRYWVHLHGML